MSTQISTRVSTVESILSAQNVREKFDAVLKEKSAGFISSVLAIWKTKLKDAEPWSVVSSAMIAASLDLPIVPSLGYAAIVPYKDAGKSVTQFQMQWKGYVQLALRTNQYAKINVSEVYDDEFLSWDPISNEFKYNPPSEWENRYKEDGNRTLVVGYVSYFRLLNGFEHYHYMTKAQIMAHGKRYSTSFKKGTGLWLENPHAMCMKTVVKLNLNKFGLLSVDLQKALRYDSAVLLPPSSGQEIEILNEPQIKEDQSRTRNESNIPEPLEKKNQEDLPFPPAAINADKDSLELISVPPVVQSKYDGKCSVCKDKISKGEDICYDIEKKPYHAVCPYRPD